MLDYLRKFKRSIMGTIAFVMLAGLMLTFGMNGPSNYSAGRANNDAPALVINEKEVSYEEYQNQIRNLDAMGRRQFGPNYDKIRGMLNVPERVVDSLVSQNLFSALIADMGLGAGVAQVREYILQNYFPTGFNESLYLDMLRQNGLTEEQHTDKVRKQIAAGQLQDLLSDVSFVSDVELRSKYRVENTKFAFQYVVASAADFEKKVDVTDEAALKKFYDENKETFRRGKSVKYVAVEFPISEFTQKVDVTKDDIDEAYESASKQFTEPRQVLVKRIAWSKEKSAPSSLEEMMDTDKEESPNNAEKKKKAEAALKRLKDGEDFDKVRSEMTEPVKGGIEEASWLPVPSLDPKFRNAAQKLDKGQYSSVIETDAGYFIIKLEDLKSQRLKPLDEVRSEVEAIVRKNLAPTYAIASAENFLSEWEKKSKDSDIALAEYAKSTGREAVVSEKAYFEHEAPNGLPPSLTSKCFSLGNGSRESVSVDGRVFVVSVDEVKPPFVPEFDQVKEAVVSAYKADKALELARTAAQAIANEASSMPLSAGVSRLAPAAKAQGFVAKTTDPKTRAEAGGTAPFDSPAAVETAFGLSDAAPLAQKPVDAGQNVYLFELSGVTLPDEGEWTTKRSEQLKAEMKRGGQALSKALLANLKRHATIVDNTQAERAAASARTMPGADY
jgi:peptidyl-prolyl cis-trans isomerase D